MNQRLVLYKQLSATRDADELAVLRADLLDRFGPLPSETSNLLEVIRLKIRCRRLGIEAIEVSGNELVMRVGDHSRIEPEHLLRLLNRPGSPIRVTPAQEIRITLRKG